MQLITQGNYIINNLSITSYFIMEETTAATKYRLARLASANTIFTLTISDITNALQEVATHRANNGAQHSYLSFASELLDMNKADLGTVTNRIADVAKKPTQLACYNILVQADQAKDHFKKHLPMEVSKLLDENQAAFSERTGLAGLRPQR